MPGDRRGQVFRVRGEQKPTLAAKRPDSLRRHERQHLPAGHAARGPQPNRDRRVQVRPAHAPHRVCHRQHDEAEGERNTDVPDLPRIDRIEHDGPGTGEDQNERTRTDSALGDEVMEGSREIHRGDRMKGTRR